MQEDNDVYRVLVTGEHDDLLDGSTPDIGDRRVEYVQVSVLDFERIPVDRSVMDQLIANPYDWIVFASNRAVSFFSECLLDLGVKFPLETQVACIGQRTAEAAALDGFNADFFPTEPGTEKFLAEFESMISNTAKKPRLFFPVAEGGRTVVAERLKALGCEVTMVPFYRSVARADIGDWITKETIDSCHMLMFTSPSSYEAFTKVFQIPAGAQVASIGNFTASYLKEKGLPDVAVLPAGDFRRLKEILK